MCVKRIHRIFRRHDRVQIHTCTRVLFQSIGRGGDQVTVHIRERMGAAAFEGRRRNRCNVRNIIARRIQGQNFANVFRAFVAFG